MEKKACGCGAKTKAELNTELKKDAKKIVSEVEGYTREDHTKKAAEVKAAFPPEKKPAAKTTHKEAPKGPTPAGMSKGPHDGDLC